MHRIKIATNQRKSFSEIRIVPQKILSNFNQYGQSAIDSTKELVEINSRLLTKVLENQIQIANSIIEKSTPEIDAASAIKDPKKIIEAQSSMVQEYTGFLKEQAETSAKVFQAAGEELKTWFEKGLKTADAAVKEASTASSVAVASVKKPSAKKPAVKKAAPKKAATKKPAAKKAAPVKPAAKKPAAKKAAPKKPAAKKPAVKKAAPVKAAAKKSAAKAPASKTVIKKAPAKKTKATA